MIDQKISFKESNEEGWGMPYLDAQRERYLAEELPAEWIDSPSKLIEMILAEHECLLKERNELIELAEEDLNFAHQTLEEVSAGLNELAEGEEMSQ